MGIFFQVYSQSFGYYGKKTVYKFSLIGYLNEDIQLLENSIVENSKNFLTPRLSGKLEIERVIASKLSVLAYGSYGKIMLKVIEVNPYAGNNIAQNIFKPINLRGFGLGLRKYFAFYAPHRNYFEGSINFYSGSTYRFKVWGRLDNGKPNTLITVKSNSETRALLGLKYGAQRILKDKIVIDSGFFINLPLKSIDDDRSLTEFKPDYRKGAESMDDYLAKTIKKSMGIRQFVGVSIGIGIL